MKNKEYSIHFKNNVLCMLLAEKNNQFLRSFAFLPSLFQLHAHIPKMAHFPVLANSSK